MNNIHDTFYTTMMNAALVNPIHSKMRACLVAEVRGMKKLASIWMAEILEEIYIQNA